jgi:CRISP-associated protein Cas1
VKNRLIEITSDGRYIHAHRGFLVIEHQGQEQARIPLDDVGAVIGNAHGLVWSNEVLVRLAERSAPLVLVSNKHMPVAMLLSLDGNHRQGRRMQRQAAAPKPLAKKLWKQLVQAKLRAQARTLEAFDQTGTWLRRLADGVRAGDPSNCEAQGAKGYWPMLMGKAFRRDPQAPDANQLFNFGYTVFRTAVARCIVAAGLHPSLGLKHANEFNAAALADDLIEPFRPLVDACVVGLIRRGETEVNPTSKRSLALALYKSIPSDVGESPIATAMERLCVSLAQVFEGERQRIELPGELSKAALLSMADADQSADT